MLNVPGHLISIYIHVPWCIKKCYYCDFNSHPINPNNNKIPEEQYIKKLLEDFDYTLKHLMIPKTTKLNSIFFGGGTPSLLSGKAISQILEYINKTFHFPSDLEITLEVNPGTIEQDSMFSYKMAGITRISLGAQSFQDYKLVTLGRIHNVQDIKATINNIIKANFTSFNIDLMYGLPNQDLNDALQDLNEALSFDPPHISWYQLAIEPNTWFYNKSHSSSLNLPTEEHIWEMYDYGMQKLVSNDYINYEISAFAKENKYCQHNLNYWQYGDYLGIGPGSHSKITKFTFKNGIEEIEAIRRLSKISSPKKYLCSSPDMAIINDKFLNKKDMIFEFMLNNLRLNKGFSIKDFTLKTGYNIKEIQDLLDIAFTKGLLQINNNNIKPTVLGRNFLNDLQALFL